MNFHNQMGVDTLLSRLLAFIIMFEKKIEFLKCRLAGNEQFHTRLAFQKLDVHKKNQISLQDILYVLQSNSVNENEANCQLFLRKYSKNGALSYQQFLKLVCPKGNKTLSQRLMIRSFKKYATLQDYLVKNLLELISYYIKMSGITEQLRRMIQKNEDLSHIQLIEFFKRTLTSPQHILSFFHANPDENYDIQYEDVSFLSYHVPSMNQISDFTQSDLRIILCPIDMAIKNNLKNTFYSKTLQREDYQQKNNSKTLAFLGKTYQKNYDKTANNLNSYEQPQQSKRFNPIARNNDGLQSGVRHNQNNNQDLSYGGLYIDNFAKSHVSEGLEINNYFNAQRKRVEVFEDDLSHNQSNVSGNSKGSAFEQY